MTNKISQLDSLTVPDMHIVTSVSVVHAL